jgi:hypothetical protein
MDVLRLRGSWAEARAELTVVTHVAQGTLARTDPRFAKLPVRLGLDGSVVGANFRTQKIYPVLSLPALTPILPSHEMVPGDVSDFENVRVLFRDARWDGETRFVGYQEVDGVSLAVLEGTLTTSEDDPLLVGAGFASVSLRSRIDPITGAVYDTEGTVRSDSVFKDGKRRVVATETFHLSPAYS